MENATLIEQPQIIEEATDSIGTKLNSTSSSSMLSDKLSTIFGSLFSRIVLICVMIIIICLLIIGICIAIYCIVKKKKQQQLGIVNGQIAIDLSSEKKGTKPYQFNSLQNSSQIGTDQNNKALSLSEIRVNKTPQKLNLSDNMSDELNKSKESENSNNSSGSGSDRKDKDKGEKQHVRKKKQSRHCTSSETANKAEKDSNKNVDKNLQKKIEKELAIEVSKQMSQLTGEDD